MRFLLFILLFTSTVQAQSIDSMIAAKVTKMVDDASKGSDARIQKIVSDSVKSKDVRDQKTLADSLKAILVYFQRTLKDSLIANQVVLDSSQFEIINKVVRVKASLLQKNGIVIPAPPVQAVNLLTFSDQFDNPIWEKANGSTITIDQIINIDSLKGADLFTAGAAQWGNLLRRSFAFANQKYTQTVYVKFVNWPYIGIRINNSAKASYLPFVNLSTLEVSNQNIPGCTFTAEQLANGWVKLNLTFITAANVGYYDIAVVDSTGNSAIRTKGTEKVYYGAAQLKPGDPGPYVKTTNAAVQ